MKQFLAATVKAVGDEADGTGEFEAVLSAPTVDRDGEVIDAGAFDPLPEHITIDIDHDLSVASTVGSGTPFYDGELLKVRGRFSADPLGQRVRGLVADGHIRTMSVAFMAAEKLVTEDEPPRIVKAELLNAAFVAVPSNRQALVLSAKTSKTLCASCGESVVDAESVAVEATLASDQGAVDVTDATDTEEEAARNEQRARAAALVAQSVA